MVRNSENTLTKTDHSDKGTSWERCIRLEVWELESKKHWNSVRLSAETLRNLYSKKKSKKPVGKDLPKSEKIAFSRSI